MFWRNRLKLFILLQYLPQKMNFQQRQFAEDAIIHGAPHCDSGLQSARFNISSKSKRWGRLTLWLPFMSILLCVSVGSQSDWFEQCIESAMHSEHSLGAFLKNIVCARNCCNYDIPVDNASVWSGNSRFTPVVTDKCHRTYILRCRPHFSKTMGLLSSFSEILDASLLYVLWSRYMV